MIQFQDLHKAFDGKQVLTGFTLDVKDGDTLVIIGYSGSGKSVALKHVVGLLHPDAGEVIDPGGLAKLTTGGVRFFAIDSNYLDKSQLDWLSKELAASGSEWKICFFHHPLYSSGATHGSALETRAVLEPMFVKDGVSVVEKTMTYAEFQAADEIFSSGNYSKLSPVTRIDNRSLQAGPLYRKARELYWDFAHS